MSEVLIRHYHPQDRGAVREIACDTADRGLPVERFFRDREVVADLLTCYYTDISPGAVWVAESAGQVIGYLTGALDSRAYKREMTKKVIPQSLARALRRGALFYPETWRLAWAGLRTLWMGGLRRGIPLEEYPAHLHINIREGHRGLRLGRELMQKFVEQVRAARLPGIHAVVRGDNVGGCRFFEAMGFTVLSRQRVMFLEGAAYLKHETVAYGKKLL